MLPNIQEKDIRLPVICLLREDQHSRIDDDKPDRLDLYRLYWK